MLINLTQIYKGLEDYRKERGLTAQNQKAGYIINVMEEFGELATALRNYEKIKNGEQAFKMTTTKMKLADDIFCEVVERKALCLADAKHDIIDAICDIAVFTINAGADINASKKLKNIDTTKTRQSNSSLSFLLSECGNFDYFGKLSSYVCFYEILISCAQICKDYGYNFEIAMLETIKEISSRTGAYDSNIGKWVKDTSPEAQAKWYKANYEKARIEK